MMPLSLWYACDLSVREYHSIKNLRILSKHKIWFKILQNNQYLGDFLTGHAVPCLKTCHSETAAAAVGISW